MPTFSETTFEKICVDDRLYKKRRRPADVTGRLARALLLVLRRGAAPTAVSLSSLSNLTPMGLLRSGPIGPQKRRMHAAPVAFPPEGFGSRTLRTVKGIAGSVPTVSEIRSSRAKRLKT